MQKLTFLLSLSLVTLTAGAALADEPAPVAHEPAVTSQAPADEVALPAELAARLTPEPIYKLGIKYGPCSVSVSCGGLYTISCEGQNVCTWKVHTSWSNYGFVECDGVQTRCTLSAD